MCKNEASDEELLASARSGDKNAAGELLSRHAASVRASLDINPKWRSVLEPDDIMQVTYMEAVLDIEKFKGDANQFPAWVRRIAGNNLVDAIKEQERPKRPQPDDRIHPPPGRDQIEWLIEVARSAGTTPSGKVSRREMKQILDAAIEGLPKLYREVILCTRRQLSIGGIAEKMGRTKGAVRLLLRRATKRLRERLGSESRFFTH